MGKLRLLFRLKHAVKELVSTKASEAYALWGSAIVSALCMFLPQACAVLDPLIQKAFNMPTHQFVGVLITYAALRFGKKVATAPITS